MDELESQVAKIQIGNFKKTSSYVYILAEKASAGNAEIYVVAELPILNPAALEPCEQICLAIAAVLKRAYRKPSSYTAFENAIAQANEELGKLASLGQANWIDKLSCIIGVKDNEEFYIATCGKVTAFLLRAGEYTDISCSSQQIHLLKAFENIAAGKLRLGDCLILSTTQLFNHLSPDRLRSILEGRDFLTATQTVIELLKNQAGPEVAFGTIFNLQVEPGETENEQIDLEKYIEEPVVSAAQESWKEKVVSFGKSVFALDKLKRKPAAGLPKANLKDRILSLGKESKKLLSKGSSVLQFAGRSVQNTRSRLSMENIGGFSRQKKILFFSVIFLAVAFTANLVVGAHIKKSKAARQQITMAFTDIQTLLGKAQSSLLYKDEEVAREFLSEAEAKLPAENSLSNEQKQTYSDLKKQLADMRDKAERVVHADISSLGGLGKAESFLKLPPYLAVQIGSTIISFDKTSGQIQDGLLLSSEQIHASVFVKNTTAVVYNGSGLLVWDYSKKQFSAALTQSVPNKDSFVGLAYYPTNQRVYLIDKQAKQIVNFAVTDKLARPVVVINSSELGNAIDMAIDGSIYVLNQNGVNKYQSGKLADFQLPKLLTPFSGKGKIYTETNWKNLYILDAGNNRILVVNKNGDLQSSLVSDKFTSMQDFAVDEKEKTAFVLNDGELLKVVLP